VARLRRLRLVAWVLTAAAVAVLTLAWSARRAEPAPDPAVGPRVNGVARPAPANRAVLWAVGDGADGSEEAKAVAARIAAGRVDRFLYLGDVYAPPADEPLHGDGTAGDYRTRYAPVYGALASRTAPTPGNHEWPNRGQGYDPYWARIMGHRQPDYYAFRAGGWQILSLNSEAPHGRGSPQLRWLAGRLRQPGTCRLAFWHRPRFSGGQHGDQPDVAPLLDAFAGHGALVVNGHDHDMQRLRPVRGITAFVSGAGGHGHYALRADPRRAFGDDRTDGALRIELQPGRARLTFVAVDGRALDTSVVACRPLGARTPGRPAA
jgi:hypothetical protein